MPFYRIWEERRLEDGLAPEEVLAEFDERVDALFRADSGKPLVRAAKRRPLGPGRGNYVRHYSYSLVAFAARCLYLDEMLDEANGALMENARHYLDHPSDINDRDSFHWHADTVLRLVEMYGGNGTRHRGRISDETEALVLEPIWEYVTNCSWLGKAEYEESKTWHIFGSENHHTMDFTINWHFSKIAKDRESYRYRSYATGGTAAEHFEAWNEYFVVYCLERARKGVCVEMMSNHYNTIWAKGIYNFYDFGDARVRRAAGKLLDLYLAYWAQEQISGVQGGGRSRVYFHETLRTNREHDMAPLAWLYFDIGVRPELSGHELNAALSDYRVPAVVVDLARDIEGRGRYEVRQRAQGLGRPGRPTVDVAKQTLPNVLRTDGGGILRYSYCDPAFIIGTLMTKVRPLSDWSAISAQNRAQGVIFAGDEGARIVPIVRPVDNRVAINAFRSVQNKGSLITQKNQYHEGGAEMIVWISKAGLTSTEGVSQEEVLPEEEGDIVFVEASGAYAAVRIVRGGYDWLEEDFAITEATGDRCVAPPGRAMCLRDEWSPVVLEVVAKGDVAGFDEFKERIVTRSLELNGSVLEYETVYGDTLTFDTGCKQFPTEASTKVPTINCKCIDFSPKNVLESPFLTSVYNSGIVTITKGDRKKILDFNV